MATGVWISYGDVAPGAKENFDIEVSEKQFDTIGNLQKYNMQLYDYANPCELYQTVLDGTAVALPSDPTTANIGLWSEQLSKDDGTFAEPITITLTSEGQYSSQGFTFTFDKFNDIYPKKLTIQWFRGETDLSDGAVEFTPDSSVYFCKNHIENFDKIIIKFYSLNMPGNRLKLELIDYGHGTVFYGDELRNVKISQSIDPISSEIKINTCDFTLDCHTDMIYSFQSKQALTVGFNDRVLSTCFVKTSKRTAQFLWEINAEDYIGILDNTPFVGGMYAETKATDILESVFDAANVPYAVSDDLKNETVTGYIPYTTCRNALTQVCFAIGAVVDTADEEHIDVVYIKPLNDDITQTIPLNRIMTGQNFEDTDTVTQVELSYHEYIAVSSMEDETLYSADESGTGDNITVVFSEPMHDIYLKKSLGKIVERGVNYAIINAVSGTVLLGQKYKHNSSKKIKKNDKVLASEVSNVYNIEDATLISKNNVDKILNRCYTYFTQNSKVNLKIVESVDVSRNFYKVKWGEKKYGEFIWGKTYIDETVTPHEPVHLGDVITTKTEYLGDITGRIIQQSFNLNGNIVVKECILK